MLSSHQNVLDKTKLFKSSDIFDTYETSDTSEIYDTTEFDILELEPSANTLSKTLIDDFEKTKELFIKEKKEFEKNKELFIKEKKEFKASKELFMKEKKNIFTNEKTKLIKFTEILLDNKQNFEKRNELLTKEKKEFETNKKIFFEDCKKQIFNELKFTLEQEKKHLLSEIKNYKKKIKKLNECNTCYEYYEKKLCFLPCGHISTCGICYDKLPNPKKCPICRVLIQQICNIYLS